MKKPLNITEADINRITSEVVKTMKQYFDEEIDIRVRVKVKEEIQKTFRDLGRS